MNTLEALEAFTDWFRVHTGRDPDSYDVGTQESTLWIAFVAAWGLEKSPGERERLKNEANRLRWLRKAFKHDPDPPGAG